MGCDEVGHAARHRPVQDPRAGFAVLNILVVAGPGAAPWVDDIRRFAERTNVGVVNTWGLKGLFRWDSPYHLGTAGLQERDFELAGVDDAEVVLGIGLDADESPRALLGNLVEIGADELDAWADRLGHADSPPARPRLYTELAAAVQPLYADDGVPRNPARAARDLAAALPPGGLVVADPGPAGLWVARTFPTTELGSVYVPSRRGPGQAVERALEAARAGRPTVLVTLDPPNDLDDDVDLVVAVWDTVDFSSTKVLVDVAGPVRAWL